MLGTILDNYNTDEHNTIGNYAARWLLMMCRCPLVYLPCTHYSTPMLLSCRPYHRPTTILQVSMAQYQFQLHLVGMMQEVPGLSRPLILPRTDLVVSAAS